MESRDATDEEFSKAHIPHEEDIRNAETSLLKKDKDYRDALRRQLEKPKHYLVLFGPRGKRFCVYECGKDFVINEITRDMLLIGWTESSPRFEITLDSNGKRVV